MLAVPSKLTCQCCGRMIAANTGVIAHHSYQRPGSGWQTQSCMGARALPYEADRTELGLMIEGIKLSLASTEATAKAVWDESEPTYFGFNEYEGNKPRAKHLSLTRANFDAMKAAYPREFAIQGLRGFDQAKEWHYAREQQRIDYYKRALETAQRRYDA